MNTIPIRNSETGEEKSFADRQAIANFLATRQDAAVWEGWQRIGELPPPEVEAKPEAETPAAAPAASEPVVEVIPKPTAVTRRPRTARAR